MIINIRFREEPDGKLVTEKNLPCVPQLKTRVCYGTKIYEVTQVCWVLDSEDPTYVDVFLKKV